MYHLYVKMKYNTNGEVYDSFEELNLVKHRYF